MSYGISYRREAVRLTPEQAGNYDELMFLVEESGSNNCWEIGNRRRARDWQCTAAGSEHDCLAEVTRVAAACCGGCLVLYGRRHTDPEQYIRAWRRAIADALPLEDALRCEYRIRPYTRITESEAAGDRRYAYETLSGQSLVAPSEDIDPVSGLRTFQWRFDIRSPEQLKLWIDTRKTGRGWHSVEV